MRAYLPAYQLKTPGTLTETLDLLAREPWKLFAGGTDLMVLFAAGQMAPGNFLNIWNLAELREIKESSDHITLGALTTYTRVQENPVLQSEFPMLCQAAFETGGIAIQNRGTLGGNIANASPAADSCPPLLAYEAELELLSARGGRWVPYHEFHTGYRRSVLRPDELIVRIRLPRKSKSGRAGERETTGPLPLSCSPTLPLPRSPAPPVSHSPNPSAWSTIGAYSPRFFRTNGGWMHYFRKVGTRKAQAISKVCFAGLAQVEEGRIADIRIALGSVAPTVIRCPQTESLLKDKKTSLAATAAAREELAKEIAPIDDMRSTVTYRRRVAENLLEEFLKELSR
ncbi:MAG TPA: FAD binding domain-containing protein [Acidobacteriota bacterium]|jgi:CO/xanthine dehydrogenase FAD-binding subunit